MFKILKIGAGLIVGYFVFTNFTVIWSLTEKVLSVGSMLLHKLNGMF